MLCLSSCDWPSFRTRITTFCCSLSQVLAAAEAAQEDKFETLALPPRVLHGEGGVVMPTPLSEGDAPFASELYWAAFVVVGDGSVSF